MFGMGSEEEIKKALKMQAAEQGFKDDLTADVDFESSYKGLFEHSFNQIAKLAFFMTDLDHENVKEVSQALINLRKLLLENGRWRQGIDEKKFPRAYQYIRIVDGDGDNL